MFVTRTSCYIDSCSTLSNTNFVRSSFSSSCSSSSFLLLNNLLLLFYFFCDRNWLILSSRLEYTPNFICFLLLLLSFAFLWQEIILFSLLKKHFLISNFTCFAFSICSEALSLPLIDDNEKEWVIFLVNFCYFSLYVHAYC